MQRPASPPASGHGPRRGADPSPTVSWQIPRRRRRGVLAGVLLGLTGLSVAGTVVVSTCTLCYAVSTDGTRPLAYIQREDTYQAAVAQVEDQVSHILRQDYAYAQEATMALTIAPKREIQTSSQLTASLMETVDQVQAAYVLTVDGVPVGACASQAAIDQALQAQKDRYTTPFTVEVAFANTLGVEEVYLPADTGLLDGGALQARLAQSWDQAGAASAALAAQLPGTWETPPEEGPLLTVRTVEEVTYTQPVDPPVEEVPDAALLLGEQQVLQEGTPGLEERTDRVTCTQGVEEARETMSVNRLTQPTPTQVAVGTAQGAEGAQGRFLWPLEGRISSPFGARDLFGSTSLHRGIDIAAPTGTPITAAAQGTVIWSGLRGTYGNLVKLDHGNGFVTYYAHCSQLLVQEGDTVDQGETIALVGSTGRSTGPHCHFEVLWQGELLDPLACLPDSSGGSTIP